MTKTLLEKYMIMMMIVAFMSHCLVTKHYTNTIASFTSPAGLGLVGSDPHPVDGPNFSGLSVEPNQTFGWNLVPL